MAANPPTTRSAPHQALYRRWRAQTFGQIVGQTAVVTTLRNAVRLGRLAHGFLFVGPRGTGKTSMARILAKAVNCQDLQDGEPCDRCPSCVSIREGRALDVIELDAASNNRVDDMRELLPRVYTAASDLRHKVFIIDEVQRIKEGWDVLLKTLEEPPPGVLFVFCTTDPSQIRPAVVSRLQRFTFRPLTVEEIEGKLVRILDADGRSAEPEGLRLIAHMAAGGMRDAESMLDQVLASADEPLTADAVRDLLGLATGSTIDRFLEALVEGDALGGIGLLDQLEAEGRDLVAFADQVVARSRVLLIERLSGRQTGPAPTASPSRVAAAARRLSALDSGRAAAGGFRWQLELALLEAGTAGTSAAEPVSAPARVAPTVPASASAPRAEVAPPAPQPTDVAALPTDAAPSASARPEGPAPAPQPPDVAASPTDAALPTEAPGPSSGTLSPVAQDLLEQVRRGWPEVVAHVARNPANRPLITACRPVDVQDGVVVLGFPEDQAFLRAIAERKRSALEEGLRQVLGRSVGVRCVAANVESPEPVGTDADDLVAHARRIFAGDLADVVEVD